MKIKTSRGVEHRGVELVCRYDHKCGKCGAKMKTINEKDMEQKLGRDRYRKQQTELACPKCGELLWKVNGILCD